MVLFSVLFFSGSVNNFQQYVFVEKHSSDLLFSLKLLNFKLPTFRVLSAESAYTGLKLTWY